MDIRVEIEALRQIKNEMLSCETALDEVKRSLTSRLNNLEFWKGQGRNAFDGIVQQLQKNMECCSDRAHNSAAVLTNALNKYVETENQLISSGRQLPADDIF